MDLFGGLPLEGGCCTAAGTPDKGGSLELDYRARVAVPRCSELERRLVDALSTPPGGRVTLGMRVFCSGPRGPTLLASGAVDVPAPSAHAAAEHESLSEMYMRRVHLYEPSGDGGGGGGVAAGEVSFTLLAAPVLRAAAARLHAMPTVSVAVGKLCLAPAVQADASLTSVWLSVELPAPIHAGPPLTSARIYATRGVLTPELLPPVDASAGRRGDATPAQFELGPAQLGALSELLQQSGGPLAPGPTASAAGIAIRHGRMRGDHGDGVACAPGRPGGTDRSRSPPSSAAEAMAPKKDKGVKATDTSDTFQDLSLPPAAAARPAATAKSTTKPAASAKPTDGPAADDHDALKSKGLFSRARSRGRASKALTAATAEGRGAAAAADSEGRAKKLGSLAEKAGLPTVRPPSEERRATGGGDLHSDLDYGHEDDAAVPRLLSSAAAADGARRLHERWGAAGGGAAVAAITFVLWSEGWRGAEEVGRASIDLRAMLCSCEEKLCVGLALTNKAGAQVAALQASVLAQHALRAAWWRGARKEHISLDMHSLKVRALVKYAPS